MKEASTDHTLLWVLVGTTLGVGAGILVAERMSGRKVTLRGLVARGKRLAAVAFSRGEELVDAATQMREAWGASEEPEEELDEEVEQELEEESEEELEDESDEDLDEDLEGASDDGSDDERVVDDEAGNGDGALDERVLEAFANDPVLAQRAVEIESEGRTILLHGRVHSAREVQHAVTIARGVPGVIEVRQRLRVRSHR